MNFKDAAEYLENWHATAQGAFALRREQMLLRRLLSPWPRRDSRMLLIGCGAGVFLKMCWEEGFDVTGLEASQTLLDAAREQLGGRAEYQLGQPDCLPFDDESFDYVVLPSAVACGCGERDRMQSVMDEALRVAARGVLAGFANRCSLWGCSRVNADPWRRGMGAWRFVRDMRKLCPGCGVTVRSVLPGPASSWREDSLWRCCNDRILTLPLGAYAAARFDLQPAIPLTPLWLRVGSKLKQQQKVCAELTTQREAGSRTEGRAALTDGHNVPVRGSMPGKIRC